MIPRGGLKHIGSPQRLKTTFLWYVVATIIGLPLVYWLTFVLQICACAPALRPVLGRVLNRKPIRPKLEGGSETLVNSRSMSLHPKEKMQSTLSSTQVWLDLEGIQVDGLGYTVTITGPEHKRKKLSKTRGQGHSALMSLSRLKGRDSSCDEHGRGQGTESSKGIVAKSSLEIRESFHEPRRSSDVQVWKSFSDKDQDMEWIDASWATIANSHLDSQPSNALQEVTKISPVPSSDGEDDFIENTVDDVTTNIPLRAITAPSSPPQLRPLSGQSRHSSRFHSSPGSRASGLANPLNSSHAWASPNLTRPRIAHEAAATEEDANRTAEMATRDSSKWQRKEGSMATEDGSRPDLPSPASKPG
jgi:hypothetical protein